MGCFLLLRDPCAHVYSKVGPMCRILCLLVVIALVFASDVSAQMTIEEHVVAMDALAQDVGQMLSFFVGALCGAVACWCLSGWA